MSTDSACKHSESPLSFTTWPLNLKRYESILRSWSVYFLISKSVPGQVIYCAEKNLLWVSREELEKQLTSFLSHISMSYWWKNSILLSRIVLLSTFITCTMRAGCVCLSIGSQIYQYTHNYPKNVLVRILSFTLQHLAESGFVVRQKVIFGGHDDSASEVFLP